MILPASEIAQRLRRESGPKEDPLVITPMPDLGSLDKSGSGSVDLRLGTWFVSPRPRTTPFLDIFDEQNDPGYSEEQFTKTSYVPFGERFILHPGNFILAVTLEWLRLPADLAGYVVGKSSWGRRGLIIATATGVHPSFTGCLTLELANVGELPIAIYPGMGICQIFLHKTAESSPHVDQSSFVGFRRPILGRLVPDTTSRLLRTRSPM